MTASEDKFAPGPWIPWIAALMVWLGWSALVPDHLSAAKESPGDGIGLVHHADNVPAPVVKPHPFTGLLPLPCGIGGFWKLPSQRLGIEVLRERFTAESRRGGIQGRAPPVEA
jgi:hypothetical protein